VISIPVPGTTAVADAIDFAEAMILLIEPLLAGTLRDARISIGVGFTPWASALSTADVQEKARFVFRTVGGFVKSISLPTFVESLFSAGSKDVDLTDTDVAAFVTAMIDGITVASTETVEPSDVREADITELEAASEAWGNARG